MRIMSKILLVEDDPQFGLWLAESLKELGSVQLASSFAQAFELVQSNRFNLIVTDFKLGSDTCLPLLQKLSQFKSLPPVIVVSGFIDKATAMALLNLHVYSVFEKPLDLSKLLVSSKEALQSISQSATVVHLDKLTLLLFRDQKIVFIQDQIVKLSATEFIILDLLIVNRGELVTKEKILSNVWAEKSTLSRNIIGTHILNIRKKIPALQDKISTIFGRGYYLKD